MDSGDIATSADGASSVFAADMDGDGDMDIVSASYSDDTIAWYENNGAADPTWTAADIATSADGARSVYAADMDGDGDMDIVSASMSDNTIAWYENNGAADPILDGCRYSNKMHMVHILSLQQIWMGMGIWILYRLN